MRGVIILIESKVNSTRMFFEMLKIKDYYRLWYQVFYKFKINSFGQKYKINN